MLKKQVEPDVAGPAPEDDTSKVNKTTENVSDPGAAGDNEILTASLRYAANDYVRGGGSWNDDDPDRPRWTSDTERVAEYEYQRPDGSHAFLIWKGKRPDGEKTFCTRWRNLLSFSDRCEPEDKVDFYTNLGDEPAIPFKLPELIKAAKEPSALVLCLEGEKDVLTAIELGFAATCNPFGAGKWRGE